jgi:hypothetical protein
MATTTRRARQLIERLIALDREGVRVPWSSEIEVGASLVFRHSGHVRCTVPVWQLGDAGNLLSQ